MKNIENKIIETITATLDVDKIIGSTKQVMPALRPGRFLHSQE